MGPFPHSGDWVGKQEFPTRFLRSCCLFLVSAAIAPFFAQAQVKDPVFAQVPFDQWVSQGNHTDLPWKVKIQGPELSNEQRLMVTARVTIDGKNLVNHAPSGELLMLIQIDDEHGHLY
jgi:hypothetical protein